ncbi:hypothetical protein AAG570_001768 [Ranatra chinensis]|uniref:PX domain-containing protein n=1 Tax=Ranatra chinensis TaxID=642074 RepID=A0ABD0YW06_9HEMI
MSSIDFPKKSITGNFSPETISSRSAGFENFLSSVAADKQLKDCLAFTSFLQRREMLESLRLIQDEQYDQNSFRLMNKMQTDRSPIVLRYLCLLVALYHTHICGTSVELGRAVATAALAVRRYQYVCDPDLLRYYVPLLRATLDLCQASGNDTNHIVAHLDDLKRKGVNVESPASLFQLVLHDLYPMLEGN